MDVSRYRSDIKEKIAEVRSLKHKDPEKAMKDCEELLEYAEDRRDDYLIGCTHFSMGDIYYFTNDIASFYYEMSKCKKPFERAREWSYVAKSHNLQGTVAYHRGNIPLAMEQFFKAFDICKEHNYEEIACSLNLNLAKLYLNTGYYDEADKYLDNAKKYIINHTNMEDYVDRSADELLTRARILIKRENTEAAWAVKNEIDEKCLTFMSNPLKVNYYCLLARLSHLSGDEQGLAESINDLISSDFDKYPVMDSFEDVFDILRVMLDREKYDEFENTYKKYFDAVVTTNVKNLQKKLLLLFIEYTKKKDLNEEYVTQSGRLVELLNDMEMENALVMTSVIDLRNKLKVTRDDLAQMTKDCKQQELKAQYDSLSGLFNRRQLVEMAEIEFGRSISNDVGFAVEFLDIDYFEEYNNGYGYAAGDDLILEIANTLKSITSNPEISGLSAYYYRGSTFAVLYQGHTEEEVFEMAKTFKNAVLELEMPNEFSPEEEQIITISQGLCFGMPKDGDSAWDYLSGAQKRLNKVKQKQRNSVELGKAKHSDSIEAPILTEPPEEKYVPAED